MKTLKLFIASLLIACTLTSTQPAKAAVGAFVGGPLLIAGLVVAGGGAVSYVVAEKTCENWAECLVAGLIIMPILGVGLILLDGEQIIAFQELDSDTAAKLGVSETELAVFNSEVDQANMLAEEVKASLLKLKKPTPEDSAKAWLAVESFVSPETFGIMKKIAAQK